jgi:hypothetical protein
MFHRAYSSYCDGKHSKYTHDIEPSELLAWNHAHGSQGRLHHLHEFLWGHMFLLLPWRLRLRLLHQALLHNPHLRAHRDHGRYHLIMDEQYCTTYVKILLANTPLQTQIHEVNFGRDLGQIFEASTNTIQLRT